MSLFAGHLPHQTQQVSFSPGHVRPRKRVCVHVDVSLRREGWHCTFCWRRYRCCSLLTLSSLGLLHSAARNTPETALTYAGWEWCQSGCWLRAAEICFSVAFHTLSSTLLNPGGLVPLWASLHHPSKSPHMRVNLSWPRRAGGWTAQRPSFTLQQRLLIFRLANCLYTVWNAQSDYFLG